MALNVKVLAATNDVGINHLPVELHTRILQFLIDLSGRPCYVSRRTCRIWLWDERDLFSPSLFPFNAAFVCTLWRDILAEMKDCWTRIVFDVSRDPTPLLRAFEWSRQVDSDNGLKVLVYCSKPELEREIVKAKQLERRRVAAIAEALQAHVHRCRSITFNVTYASSLPPSYMFFLCNTSHLVSLSLTCRVDDSLDTDNTGIQEETDDIQLANSFPELTDISLPGQGFMDLARVAYGQNPNGQWFSNLNIGNSHCKMFISTFTFPLHGRYSLLDFISYVSQLSSQLFSVHLQHLSLAYEYHNGSYRLPSNYALPQIPVNIYFNSVSDGFLEHFYAIADVCPPDIITFEDCTVPENVQSVDSIALRLKNMVEKKSRADGLPLSLCRILGVWGGTNLSIEESPAFNDALLRWMRKERKYYVLDDTFSPSNDSGSTTVDMARDHALRPSDRWAYSKGPFKSLPAWRMDNLSIHGRANFSPSVLRETLQARQEIVSRSTGSPEIKEGAQVAVTNNTNAHANPARFLNPDDADQDVWYQQALYSLYVCGKDSEVPPLSEEDKDWFMANEENLQVHWEIETVVVDQCSPRVDIFKTGRLWDSEGDQ